MARQNDGHSRLFPAILVTYPDLGFLDHPRVKELVSAVFHCNRMVRSTFDILSTRSNPSLPQSLVPKLLRQTQGALTELQNFSRTPGVYRFIEAETARLRALEAKWQSLEVDWEPNTSER